MLIPIRRYAIAVVGALLVTTAARADITLSETPLFLSNSVTPNVMLLFDNSGSMNNIIWDDGFDPAVTYPDWANYTCDRGNVDRRPCWNQVGDGNVRLEEIYDNRGDCNSFTSGGLRIRGRKNNTTRCLVLPDPVGSGLTRYDGNYLNYLFETYANTSGNNGRNLIGTIPADIRIAVARSVATGIVNDNDELRWGLARFNPPTRSNSGPGGRVIQACGAPIADLTAAIDGLSPNSNTPLAESYYEITRYFRGMSSYYNSNLSYSSPIEYRCQKNFVIVVTDGFPTFDTTFPTDDPDDLANTARSLPNWDLAAPPTSASTYPLFPQYSDGFQPSGSEGNEGYSLFLDDLARFGYDTDMRKTGNDLTGVSFNDSSFQIQRLQTYTVGLAINNQMLRDAAAYGNGQAYIANNATQLRSSLQAALNDIASRTSAAASVATNSTRLTVDTAIYQARFSTGDWSGQLLALPVRLDGSVDEPIWDASQRIPAANLRDIFTYDPTANANNRGKTFEWNQLNATQKAHLNTPIDGVVDSNGEARLNYLRGDRSNEGSAGLQFRNRSRVLGDIVNADPAFAGKQDYGFSALPGSEGSSYASFIGSNSYRDRPPMIYVGANDGMLHGFQASDGAELLAYVPNAVYPRLSHLSAPAYNLNHKYYVDGAARVLDVRINNNWQTALVGSLGGGGRAVFALNITDPVAFGPSKVLWEFSNANDGDMGFSYPQPTMARMADGSWAAIVANGYNSDSGEAVLFIIDVEDGSVLKKISTGVAGGNGLSSPVPVDVDGDRITDLIYAGDLKGNLWKFDVRSGNRGDWAVAFSAGTTPLPLHTACKAACNGSNFQPITTRPEVGINPAGGYVVYFGTGRYFAAADNTVGSSTDNTFYGIYDADDGSSRPGGRADLLQQSVLATLDLTVDGVTENVRVTTNNTPDANDQGWYLDLPLAGERQVSTPILRGGAVIFTTLIPNTDACGFGGDSYLMEVDALTGSRLASTPFDINRDTLFNESDYATYNGERVPVSGRRSKEGIIKTPAIIEAGAFEVKLASGTTGGIDITFEPPAGSDPGGRQSWRQLQ